MKKTVSKHFISALIMIILCTSICACGSGGKKISEQELTDAFQKVDGQLETEKSGENVTSFIFTVEDVDAEELSDAEYVLDAISTVMTGDPNKITGNMLKVSHAYNAVLRAMNLFENNKETSDIPIEDTLDILCGGKTKEYGNWSLSMKINIEDNSLTITGNSK